MGEFERAGRTILYIATVAIIVGTITRVRPNAYTASMGSLIELGLILSLPAGYALWKMLS